jgi:predicted O-methyltransferase YrrM
MKTLRINFDSFGDREKASSRLRAWMVADQLRTMGHEVSVNGSLDVDIQVFQKRRDVKRLQTAKRNGARIVFDFDDHYLLDDVGAKDDMLAFMNQSEIVAVGSQALLEEARRYHDHVILFENPLDVSPGSVPKSDYSLRGHVGWFGAPENQGVLYDLGLREAVSTVTTGGDIPWNLETIDDVVQQFDLVIIPVEADAWALAKNANRLLKCVALGVPFLASRTPEHERVVRELGLPDWLLIDAGGDWRAGIVEAERRLAEFPSLLGRARERALARYGIAPVTARWLHEITTDPATRIPAITIPARNVLAAVDVIVFGEDAPARVVETLGSLRRDEAKYHSVSVVSALAIAQIAAREDEFGCSTLDRHADFFDIYDCLAHVLRTRSGAMTLLLQAGAVAKRGLLNEIEAVDAAAIHLFRGQTEGKNSEQVQRPPSTIDQLLTRPYRPVAVLLPNDALDASQGLQARFGPLALWELLISLVSQGHAALRAVSAPLVMIAPELVERTPMHSYREMLEGTDPDIAADLPSMANEWERLLFSRHAAVIEEHESLFRYYQSTVIPRLEGDLRRRKSQRSDRQRERDRSGRWLEQLHARSSTEAPRLVQSPAGTVYLVEAGLKRHVKTWLMVNALEALFGGVERNVDDLAAIEDGPPVDVLADPDGRVYVIAGGQRFRVQGLPVPTAANAEALQRFPEAHETIDLYRGPKRTSGGSSAKGSRPTVREVSARKKQTPRPRVEPAPAPASGELPLERRRPHQPNASDIDVALASLPIVRHVETWVKKGELGKKRRYRPTFGTLPVINESHRKLFEAPLRAGTESIDVGIPDALRRADAAKLYELAYFGHGDVLVLGSGRGLSATIVTQAIQDASREARVIAVDGDPHMVRRTRANLDASGGVTVDVVQQDPEAFCRERAELGNRFGLVFIDYLTDNAEVRAVCRVLPDLVAEGGFVLFHDFNDRRNGKVGEADAYGIYSGVKKGLSTPPFAFYGVFGSVGLYRLDAAPGG